MSNDNIINEYDDFVPLANEFSDTMKNLVNVLLSSSDISLHSISCRVKERVSLIKKIENKDKYSELREITDVIGLRIITLYSDEVDLIAEIIENEFSIDKDNTIDKRKVLDPDRFGYLSLHYVVSLKSDRESLAEYNRFAGLKFEIQIRSILQHTWAEIEHDIGYKSKGEIPKSIRRQFSRLAGLLELADIEFDKIRKTLENYEKEIERTINKDLDNIEIDAVSIVEFLNNNKIVQKINEEAMKAANFSYLNELDRKRTATHIAYLEYFNIKTILELLQLIQKNRKNILLRASDINAEGQSTNKGISVFYLYQVLGAKLGNEEKILKFLEDVSLSKPDEKIEFSKYLFELAKKFV